MARMPLTSANTSATFPANHSPQKRSWDKESGSATTWSRTRPSIGLVRQNPKSVVNPSSLSHGIIMVLLR